MSVVINGISYPNASVVINTNEVPGTPPVVPPYVPPYVPPVVPPVVTPPAGPDEVFGGGDVVWPMQEQYLWPSQAGKIAASGDLGTAIKFVVDAGRYPRGIKLILTNESNYGLGGVILTPEVTISDRPHNFETVGGQTAAYIPVGNPSEVLLRFGNAGTVMWYDVMLNPGQVYYLNVRDYHTPRGTVYLQLDARSRTD